MGIFLLGALGLAIDGSHLYAHRQMAQAAADAAAQAGIMSIFDGTNGAGAHAFATGSTITCASSDPKTPCYYAQTLNGFNDANDVVTVDFPTAADVGVSLSSLSASDPVNLLRVTIQRRVDTTLIRLLGPSFEYVSASGTAAILGVLSPIPIIVTHPTRSGSFDLSGTGSTPKIQICGGGGRSIQVNSSSGSSLTSNGNPIADLSHAGPKDPGNCTTGTGGTFANSGSQSSPGFPLQLGTTGRYVSRASWMEDPLKDVVPPSPPTSGSLWPTNPTATSLADGVSGCPSPSQKACMLYSPGVYTNPIHVQNQTAVFKPGIYYMNGVNFETAANGYMTMATGLTDDSTGTNTGWTGNILVYMTGSGSPASTGAISVGANGSVSLVGSPDNSSYRGILFFVDRNAASQTHTLDGGGGLTLIGTVYATPTRGSMLTTPSRFQTLDMSGNAGSSTHITGEIIVSALSLGGTPGIVMTLSALPNFIVRQVALVQ
jgi:Flp pilus assembly protein TadG